MSQNEQWTSKLGFILASAGSAIGIGAIWKLPYVAGTSGGGAFFLLFILFTAIIGLPLLLAEFVLGRHTQKEAIRAYDAVAPGSLWKGIGYLGVITCFILLSFYSVVGGWILQYIFASVTGQLNGVSDYGSLFNSTIANPTSAVISQFVFLLLTIVVVARGIQNGIEKANKILMPALFILFIIIIIRSLTLDGAMEGVSFFLYPDFSKLTSQTILFAMGQAFFSLSVGVSVMVTYSSYLSKQQNLPKSAISISALNILISLLAGLAIFPAVFSMGVKPTEGPGLLFIVLPSIFEQLPFGIVFQTFFLALFLFATLTSAFSMLEIIVASLAKGEQHKRIKLSWISGLLIFVVGIPSALSYGLLSDVSIFGKSIFDAFDFLVSNILMPLGALLIAIFVPWKMKKDVLIEEFKHGSANVKRWFSLWLLAIRYIAPVLIIIVFINMLGFI
ncbi:MULTISPECIES: sodium-dependent transporter [Priestia]|jgi:NSS family neurotransmitter:Na+ symporter|uniref:sodium-dependent transporter n=1 Tax=Priestia TaxID=2800373 RepID=UPI000BF433EC|nr:MULTISPECIES: sodium-dependent transporter [Priestia]MBW0929513.1 sodium-dependent transporter [Priestia megaterium]MCA4153329.1 sodium-dependent transporter [Priestia megaterium]MDP1439056.1 sodium-dependent transporter [Priestia megaterium]MDP1468073.1 sodium-dependent transporter [Priestia megaterium]MDR0129753.1 sodium-dependent transporter [Priestia megaterium]